MMPKSPRFNLVIEVPHWASEADGIRRRRAMLKRLSRSCGVHCVSVVPADEHQPKLSASDAL
jgi:hypothetical protein